jgi:heterodisulfide reductase subunit A
MNPEKIIIVGGGVAGMSAAATLRNLGYSPVIVEKDEAVGGKLRQWHKLFPSLTPAGEVIASLARDIDGIEVLTGREVAETHDKGIRLADGTQMESDAVIISSGFDIFRAELKEEYGYGLYNNVYTTVDIERMLNEGHVRLANGEKPSRIAFLHCVGSRDEKVNQRHCSRVCCITGVKQAMELKEMFPESEVFNFYMDIRMFGPGYEEMYRRAQEDYNIQFIRGRISEAAEDMNGHIRIKAEDTLVGRPLQMTVDMLILIVGMTAGSSNAAFAGRKGMELAESGFMQPRDMFTGNVCARPANVFYAGTVTAPKNVGESINEGAAAAISAVEYLKNRR